MRFPNRFVFHHTNPTRGSQARWNEVLARIQRTPRAATICLVPILLTSSLRKGMTGGTLILRIAAD
jgi:hypothetical protein